MKYIITAILCSIILGYSFISVQENKQESIERQKQMEITQRQKEINDKNQEEFLKQNDLDICLKNAHTKYLEYAKLNGRTEDGSIFASRYIWSEAQKIKDSAVDICFKKYK